MYKSFCFTCRPAGKGQPGLSEKTEKRFLMWMKKKPHAVAVIEGEDENRHMHGQIWLDTPCTKGQVNTQLKRMCYETIEKQHWLPSNKTLLCQGTQIAYSDWYESYLDPETRDQNEKSLEYKYHVINNPPDMTEGYYPSQEEQEKVQEKHNAVDQQMHRWEQAWIESKGEYGYSLELDAIDRFVRSQWFVKRKELGPRDPKAQKFFIQYLYMYINKCAEQPDWKGLKELMDDKRKVKLIKMDREIVLFKEKLVEI